MLLTSPHLVEIIFWIFRHLFQSTHIFDVLYLPYVYKAMQGVYKKKKNKY